MAEPTRREQVREAADRARSRVADVREKKRRAAQAVNEGREQVRSVSARIGEAKQRAEGAAERVKGEVDEHPDSRAKRAIKKVVSGGGEQRRPPQGEVPADQAERGGGMPSMAEFEATIASGSIDPWGGPPDEGGEQMGSIAEFEREWWGDGESGIEAFERDFLRRL